MATSPHFDEPQGDAKPVQREGDTPPATVGPLSPDELLLLHAFFELLDEWDRKKKII